MKKLLFVLPLAIVLFAAAFAFAGAGEAYDDPKLCVNGKWLLVIASHPDAATVLVPADAKYGDQKAGGCKDPGPNVALITKVFKIPGEIKSRGALKLPDGVTLPNELKLPGKNDNMFVFVDGKRASDPLKVSYGDKVQTRKNNKTLLMFWFKLG